MIAPMSLREKPNSSLIARRADFVARITSSLVDVTITGPGCTPTDGMIMPDVLPRRGGPSTKAWSCLAPNDAIEIAEALPR